MAERKGLSPIGAEIAASLDELIDALESDEPLEARFTVRKATLDLVPHEYTSENVKEVRLGLGASQPLLAKFLGVSVKTLRSWEQGSRPVPTIAARFLDEIQASPEIWTRRLRISAG